MKLQQNWQWNSLKNTYLLNIADLNCTTSGEGESEKKGSCSHKKWSDPRNVRSDVA
jgi:hypothetical protein